MRIGPIYRCARCLLAAGLIVALPALGAPPAAAQNSQPPAGPVNIGAAMAQYRAALEDYNQFHAAYAAAADAYWRDIAAKRRLRNAKRAHGETPSLDDYVLTQPPIYSGPPKPRNPLKPEVPPQRVYVPVVADFLSAAEREFKFAPQRPQSDDQFKRVYAGVALAAGLTRDQIVRIYGFEATGNGSYDVEAGREYNTHARAITTALGYNQLLATNTVEIVAEDGNHFLGDLQARDARLPIDQTMGAGEQDRGLAPDDCV